MRCAFVYIKSMSAAKKEPALNEPNLGFSALATTIHRKYQVGFRKPQALGTAGG